MMNNYLEIIVFWSRSKIPFRTKVGILWVAPHAFVTFKWGLLKWDKLLNGSQHSPRIHDPQQPCSLWTEGLTVTVHPA